MAFKKISELIFQKIVSGKIDPTIENFGIRVGNEVDPKILQQIGKAGDKNFQNQAS